MQLRRGARLGLLMASMVATTLAVGPPTAADEVSEAGPLAAYVAKEDASYGWREVEEGRVAGNAYAKLTLTSQTWQGRLWRHELFVIRPLILDPDATHALLFISGGKWGSGSGRPDAALPDEAPLVATVANLLRTPTAILRHVPYQPIDGMTEDALIAHTFQEYLRNDGDDPERLLLLPMVKTAVRAMDAVQEYTSSAWGLEVDRFTLAGASKRGWTTWLTGAVDRRVLAIAPMVFNVLNMAKHIAYQKEVWGELSEELADYESLDLPDRVDEPVGRQLLRIVDPYHYLRRIQLPKLIVLGTNDAYWPVDSLDLYWRKVQAPRYVSYVPNAGHSLGSMVRYSRVIGALVALHRHVGSGEPLPALRWRFRERDGRLIMKVRFDQEPRSVAAWVAHSDSLDFREARYVKRRTERLDDGLYRFEIEVPTTGYVAVFGDVAYRDDGPVYRLTTKVKIAGPAVE